MHLPHRDPRESDDDRGFTLIELLAVVVIIGILVAIAIPLYLNYRKGAENKTVQSDVRNAIVTMEQCFADRGDGTYGTAAQVITAAAGVDLPLSCPTAAAETVKVSAGNTLKITIGSGSPTTFVVNGTNGDTGYSYTYDSSTSSFS